MKASLILYLLQYKQVNELIHKLSCRMFSAAQLEIILYQVFNLFIY